MFDRIDPSLISWSRAQFAMTALYHWIFVPLTLGITLIIGIMEAMYYRSGLEKWKKTAKFWMKLFGINFCVGVATGLILEFEFGTNWSNYSWLVGDIFGAPLAIEGIVAFFLETTFICVMFFGWNKFSKGFHLASTWLTWLGATLSAWWILVANAWMQFPAGMQFNPDTMRNEMTDFAAVALSPVAVNKFFHTVLSGWILAAVFVVGISCWFLLRKREKEFAISSMKIATIVGLFASVLSLWSGDGSAYEVAKVQPMKLAAMEGLYNGKCSCGLTAIGILNPNKQVNDTTENTFLAKIEIPSMLSILATRDSKGFVPGINDIVAGGYKTPDGTKALSVTDKMAMGKTAISALSAYQAAKKAGYQEGSALAYHVFKASADNIGYGYLSKPEDAVPNVPMTFYSFHLMVMLGGYFILFFLVMTFIAFKRDISKIRWMQWVSLWSIPLAYIAGMAGWIVAEVGRQPWTIQDMLPSNAAISRLATGSVKVTFFIFVIIFTVLLIAGIKILCKAINKGPQIEPEV
jgi:cytochrome d ubiquinol oxidase subunit I